MNVKSHAKIVAALSPEYESFLRDELKTLKGRGRPAKHQELLEYLGPAQVSYVVLHTMLHAMAPGSRATHGSLVGAVGRALDLEFRMRRSKGDAFTVHRGTGQRRPRWVKIKAVMDRTEGAPVEGLNALGLVAVAGLTGLYPDVFLTTTSWTANKMQRWIHLDPEVSAVLLTKGEIHVPLFKAEPWHTYGPTSVDFPEARRGGYRLDTQQEDMWPWLERVTRWRLDNTFRLDLKQTLDTGAGPLGVEPRTGQPPEDLEPALKQVWYRERDKEGSHWISLRLAERELRGLGEFIEWPVQFDFRGRLYLTGYSSPHLLKDIRRYLRSPSGGELTFYDMRTSNVTLLSLLMGKDPGVDLYEETAGLMEAAWCGILEDTLGVPSRAMAKDWLKARYFGQTKRDCLHNITRTAVHTGTHHVELHHEIVRVLDMVWDHAESRVPTNLFTLPEDCGNEPVLVTPDNWRVPLGYRKSTARRIKSSLLGRVPSLTTRRWVDGSLDKVRTKRALCANIVHSLEAYVLRSQLRSLEVPVLPVHDCLGLPSGVDKEALASTLCSCVRAFSGHLRAQGYMDEYPPCFDMSFGSLYQQEEH